MAEPSATGARVELVRRAEPAAQHSARVGVGLLVSLLVGWPSIRSALLVPDTFEASVLRFLAAVVLSVAAVMFLGGLYDRFTTAPAVGPPASDGDRLPGDGAQR